MITITGDDALILYKTLFDINKPLKAIPIGIPNVKSTYMVMNNQMIALDFDRHTFQTIGSIVFNKKNQFLEKIFEQEDFIFYVDSDALFQFDKAIKESKLTINEIIIYDGQITIITSGITNLVMKNPDSSKFNNEINKFMELLESLPDEASITNTIDPQIFKDTDKFKKAFWLVISEDRKVASVESYDYILEPHEYGISLRPKDILDLNVKTQLSISVFPINDTYAMYTIDIETKKYVLTQYFKAIII